MASNSSSRHAVVLAPTAITVAADLISNLITMLARKYTSSPESPLFALSQLGNLSGTHSPTLPLFCV